MAVQNLFSAVCLLYHLLGEHIRMEQMLYTIEELGDATGITPRTIRYYTTEGILPPPESRGRYALYANEHLHRLQLIVRLKSAFLPLHAIKEQMEGLSYEEVYFLLNDGASVPQEGGAETTPPVALPEVDPNDSSNRAFLARVLANRRTLNARRVSPITTSLAAPSDIPEEDKVRLKPKDNLPGDEWRRIALMPGVELHVQTPINPNVQVFIRKAKNAARRYGG